MVPVPLVTVMPSPAVTVDKTGSVVPSPMGICPLAAAPKAVIALVPLPSKRPPSVRVVAPVPPFATGSVPVTSADISTLLKLLPVPFASNVLLVNVSVLDGVKSAAIDIVPLPLVTVISVPPVMVALARVLPLVLPISN